MNKKIFLILAFCISTNLFNGLIAQSSNFIAQGYYYKAKDLFEKSNYKDAIGYIQNSKISLQGTNYQLQYIHILTLVKLSKYNEAKAEMETYFRILEDTKQAKGFTKIVERLTDDETKALSKLMVDIMENATIEQKNIPINKINQILSKTKGIYYPYEIVGFRKGYVLNASFTLNGNQLNFSSKNCTHATEYYKSPYPKYYEIQITNIQLKKGLISITPQDFRQGDIVELLISNNGLKISKSFYSAYYDGSGLKKESYPNSADEYFYAYVLRSDINEFKILLKSLINN